MNTTKPEPSEPVAGPVERPVRPDSEQWVRAWFAEHYQAGDVFAHCDAEAMTLQAAVKFARAVAAAERQRWAMACDTMRRQTLAAQSGSPDALANLMLRQLAELGFGECASMLRDEA